MRDLAVLLLHLLTTIVRLAGPRGARSLVAESLLLKQQLLILNRTRKRAPNLRLTDRAVAGVCAHLVRPTRLVRLAIVLKPATICRVPTKNSIRASELMPSWALGSCGPDRRARIETIETSADRFLDQLTGQ